LNTKEMRKHAEVVAEQAYAALAIGNTDEFKKLADAAEKEMEKAEEIDKASVKAMELKSDFEQTTNTIPVTSKDVEVYDANDTTRKMKADYRPASWVKGLPAAAQPLWVQEQMGDNQKDQVRVYMDAFTKWATAPREEMFWKSATPDEIKAMQEDTDAEGKEICLAS